MTTPATRREMTQAQRGRFAGLTKRIFNKALHTLGREAEEITRSGLFKPDDPLQDVMTVATFKLDEVVYTITIAGHREEMS